MGLVEQSRSRDKDHPIAGREYPGRFPPLGHIGDQRFGAVELGDLVWHDPPEQAHPPQGSLRVAYPQRRDVVALFGFDPSGSACPGSHDDEFGLDGLCDVRSVVGHGCGDRMDVGRKPRFGIPTDIFEHRFGAQHDPIHHLDDDDRMVADGRLAAEHTSISAVEDRVGHVAGFGSGRSSIVMHALEHLGGDDNRLHFLLADLDDPFLRYRSLGYIDFDT